MNLNFNFFNIIIFAGIIQGFLFGIVVLTSRTFSDKANKYLALTIISLSLNNSYYWFIDIGLLKQFVEINLFYLPWHLLFPVTFYLYVYEYINEKIKKQVLWILLVPFITSSITNIIISVFYKRYGDHPLWVDVFSISEEYVAFILALTIGYLSFKKLKKAKRENIKINIKWLKILLRAGLILCLIWMFVFSLSVKFDFSSIKLYYPVWLGISIMFYWIGYRGLYQFKLAKDRKAISILLQEIKNSTELRNIDNTKIEEFTEDHPIYKKLKNLVEHQHIYRQQNLTLDSMAVMLETNRSTLSKLINEVSEKGFSDFINTYRIKEAKELLCNHDFDKYKISAIGFEVGFNRAGTFYEVFKKHTGVTPTKFKQNCNKDI